MLQKGASGEFAEVLQRALNARAVPAPNITVDGDFGDRTEAAVKQLQSQVGLASNGVVDRSTWEALGPLIDPQTGSILAAYAPKLSVVSSTPGSLRFGGSPASYREIPQRAIFMPIGHCWWAILLGYVGGVFARMIYLRRTGDDKRSSRPESDPLPSREQVN
jgi:peptidoglycan hydrolase-like protein with peptidoglycan-binding domain